MVEIQNFKRTFFILSKLHKMYSAIIKLDLESNSIHREKF